MDQFNFIAQHPRVEELLQLCEMVLKYVPESEKGPLISAMREFENFGVPTLWSAADVDKGNEFGLTEDEKREVICRFIDDYECKESDWSAIGQHACNVQAERDC